MKIQRQDAWSQDEDTLLAETIVNHIRMGSTQLKAFEEVGRQLSRTASACGFRWNSCVRRLYKEEIQLAKKERKQQKSSSTPVSEESKENSAPLKTDILSFQSFDDLLSYLRSIQEDVSNLNQLREEIIQYQEKVTKLENQLHHTLTEKEKIHKQLSNIQTEYESLLAIMERARKMVLSQE